MLPLLFFACKTDTGKDTSSDSLKPTSIRGKTMGTTFHVQYLDVRGRNFQKEINQLLGEVNMELSPYIDEAYISRFNRTEEQITLSEKEYSHFTKVYDRAKAIFEYTQGAFDPTIMPLVNYWGFGYTGKDAITVVDSQKVDSLRLLVGFEKLSKRETKEKGVFLLFKSHPGIKLDFGGIAKGYGIDVLAGLLEQEGIQNYLVDIGGESRAKGKNGRNTWWRIGINTPKEGAALNDIEAVVSLANRSVATSGNYRNFHEADGRKYGHEINPKTGYPEKNSLLSVSVFAPDCMTADALATACMILGLEKSRSLVKQLENIDALFIYGARDGSMELEYTAGLKSFLHK